MQSRQQNVVALATGVSLAAASVLAAQTANLGEIDTSDGVNRTVTVWAEPGLTRSPVSFTIGPDGRLYVAESDRAGNAVTDTRQLGHLDAVWEDGQLRTVEDRRALMQRWVDGGHFEPDFWTRTEDRVRVVMDTDADGVADTAEVFAGGFDDAVDGIASGVMWSGDTLLFTNIPHLWALRDVDGDGTIDDDPSERRPISSGYGVRWCFYGHDLHGLALAPDGRIWFTIGDRGYNVTSQEGERFVGADRGAAFRCWPDGTGLEMVHEGLRNPQELAFDVLGNPFTGDNNCDSGDRARVTLVVDGGDSGWRQDVQSLPSRGPWNREKLWHEIGSDADFVDPTRPAWAFPPIAHVAAGPSGFTLQPGTGESGAYDGALMMVDFYGSGSTVHAMRMTPRGAWFDLEERRTYYRGATVTDIEWGPDGRLYMTDWGGGWSPNPNGRVLVVTNEDVHGSDEGRAAIADARAWLEANLAERDSSDLVASLGHRDRRVRVRLQMELATRGGWVATMPGPADAATVAGTDVDALVASLADRVARAPEDGTLDLGAVHALWALGQMAWRSPAANGAVLDAAGHPSATIRAEAFEIVGDLGREAAGDVIAAGLADAEALVRAAAVRAFGRCGGSDDPVSVLRGVVADGAAIDVDPVLRNAAVVALDRTAGAAAIAESIEGANVAWRRVATLALRRSAAIRVGEDVPVTGPRAEGRRIAGGALADRLVDEDLLVATEAARAIYDMHLGAPEPFGAPARGTAGAISPFAGSEDAAFRRLAMAIDDLVEPGRAIEPLVRRMIEANLRLGDAAAAQRLVAFAGRSTIPAKWRMLALERLEAWGGSDRRERVWGHWIPRPARDVTPVIDALSAAGDALVASAGDDREMRFRVDRIRARLTLDGSLDELASVIADANGDPRYRAVVVREAVRRFPGEAATIGATALAAPEPTADLVRMAGLDVLREGSNAEPERVLEIVRASIAGGTRRERQHAASVLADLARSDDDAAMDARELALRLIETEPFPGTPDPVGEIRLELYRTAASAPEGSPLGQAARSIDAAAPAGWPGGFGADLLGSGGDPAAGERLVRTHPTAQCVRCHAIGGEAELAMAGPPLDGVGRRLNRRDLVTALVDPAAEITPGYGTVAAMPEMSVVLSPAEIRDVVAFLATLDARGEVVSSASPAATRVARRRAASESVSTRQPIPVAFHVMGAFAFIGILVTALLPRR